MFRCAHQKGLFALRKTNKHTLGSEVHNTARFQWVYINLVMDCVLTLGKHFLILWVDNVVIVLYLYSILSNSDMINALYMKLNDIFCYK